MNQFAAETAPEFGAAAGGIGGGGFAASPAGGQSFSRQQVTNNPTGLDAYAPAQMATRVAEAGVAKAHLPALPTLVLAVLGGAFIAFGGMFYTLIVTEAGLGLGPGRLLGGVGFSLGLILVIVGGAELFTGNALIVMAWASRRVSTTALLRNWVLVYLGNLAGALGAAALVYLSGALSLGDGAVGQMSMAIATAKVSLSPGQAFFRGILGNALVCLAVWLCFAAPDATGKILAIIWPISAFVALGFEHSVANMYLIPIGMAAGAAFDVAGLLNNLVWVTLGNIIGGAGGVALAYWTIYLRARK